MKIGDIVQSQLYKGQEQGRIIDAITLDEASYYEIFFPESKETLTLEDKDVQKVTGPLENLISENYTSSMLFRLRIIAEKIDSLLYQDKLITANNFKIVPLPHQILAVNNVLGQFMPRCLIADEVGLGKTIEASLIYEELKLRGMVKRILIISPAGLTVQWRDELKTKFNEEFSILDRNSFKAMRELYGNINVWAKSDRIITSLDFLKPKTIRDSLPERQKRKREEHNKMVTGDCIGVAGIWLYLMKCINSGKDSEGSETSRYKLGKSLSEVAPIFLLLSATPHQGDSEKFRHLLSLIDEYKFYSLETIVPENVRSVTVKNRKRSAVDFKGDLIFKARITSIARIERDERDIEVELYNEVTDYVSQYYKLASREGNFTFMFLLILYQRMVSSSLKAIYHSLSEKASATLRSGIIHHKH